MKTYGLIGKNIEYSFSKSYFTEKFKFEKLKCEYLNFDINKIDDFHVIFDKIKNLSGLNVTIPFKQSIISKLDNIHKDAKQIGAVNTIKVTGNKLIGYNTDHLGFKESITPFLKAEHKNALILGTGGAAKAVEFAFKSMNIKSNGTESLSVRWHGIKMETDYRQKMEHVCTIHLQFTKNYSKA